MDNPENPESIFFLFDMTKQVKNFYETPVIFLTKKDYSDSVFNTMCSIRSALKETSSRATQTALIDSIVDYHLNWLYAVNEIFNFKKIVHETSRDDIYGAISFTIDALSHRLKYYQIYMEKNRKHLNNEALAHLQVDLEVVEEMHKDTTKLLLDKLKCFRNFVGDQEFHLKVYDAVEELLQWLDKINDALSKQLTNYVNINVPHLHGDLTKTLQLIVEELQSSKSPSAIKLLDDLKERGRQLSTMIRVTADKSLEISKLVEKINVLEERIERLEHEPSSAAVMALKHKKEYLERQLESLENLKVELKSVTNLEYENVTEEELCICPDFYQLRIFNHMLPAEERERLVTELCYLWDMAVFGEKNQSHKSIISILSAAEMKEEFTDDLGTFYIDEYSRKIYKLPDDETLYQPNEQNQLVPLSDDGEHIYFYDECGRYFIDATRQRVYKYHATASEYMMDSSGILLKVKEIREGITYFYDNFGRYYINDEGKHIYREVDTISEYENDGLGNLVRIRSHLDIFEPCPDDAHVTEDFKYLQNTVGPALRHCIAQTIIYQPPDPIKYLCTKLENYRANIELRDIQNRDKEVMMAERQYRAAEERAAADRAAMEAALLAQGGSEASYDSNFLHYNTADEDDAATVTTK